MPRILGNAFTWLGLLLASGAVCVIAAGCGRGDPEAAGMVRIETSPASGAEVRVGPRLFGVSPAVISGLPAGDIYVIATLDGYNTGSQLVHVPERGEIFVTIELEPLVGYLTVESDPPDAKVYLDGTTFLGHTPVRSAAVSIGEHSYELRLDNYASLDQPITIEEERRYMKNHQLTPLKSELLIVSSPTGAQIWIDEQLKEETTPAKYLLAPGEYSIGVYAKGYIMGEQVVTLEPNARQDVEITLKQGEAPPNMVLIPAGEFIFGHETAPEERPRGTVHVDAFYIDKFEVTNADFKKYFPNHTFDPGLDTLPVTGVSWIQANEYARQVGKRLPREVEWEKAARGTDGREWPWGNTYDPKNSNSGVEFNPKPAKIGSFRNGASVYGVMDMAGNAYEWVADWYDRYPGNTDVTTDYGMVYRVIRGGSYLTKDFDVRCAARHFDKPESIKEDYGFRCAMDVVDTPQTQRAPLSPAPAKQSPQN